MLLSPALAERLIDAQVDVAVRGWEKTSDHAPVWIELSDNKKPSRRTGLRRRDSSTTRE
jgi:exodeoxyribonuclease-3